MTTQILVLVLFSFLIPFGLLTGYTYGMHNPRITISGSLQQPIPQNASLDQSQNQQDGGDEVEIKKELSHLKMVVISAAVTISTSAIAYLVQYITAHYLT